MKYVLLLSLLIAQPAFGRSSEGDEKGNGGDVLVCRDASERITSVEMLDYFEARVLRGIQVNLPNGNSPEEIAVLALGQLRRLSPMRAKDYTNLILSFVRQARFVPGVNLIDIPDSDHRAVPNGCKVTQLVVQQRPEFPEDARFLVDQDIWAVMDDRQRAGAILHEAFYTEALRMHHQSSRRARYFHTKMLSAEATRMTELEFANLTENAGFLLWEIGRFFQSPVQDVPEWEKYDMSQHQFDPRNLAFSPDGRLTQIKDPSYANLIRYSHPLIGQEKRKPYDSGYSDVELVEVKSTAAGPVVSWKLKGGRSIRINSQDLRVRTLKFHPDESIELSLYNNQESYVDPATGRAFRGDLVIESDGRVRQVAMANLKLDHWEFQDPSGQTKVEKVGGTLHFYDIAPGAVARYRKAPFDLEFTDLANLGIYALESKPVSLSDTTKGVVPLSRASVFGQSLGEEIVFLDDSKEPGAEPGFVKLRASYGYYQFSVRSRRPIQLSPGFANFSTRRIYGFNEQAYLAFPLEGFSFSLQGKTVRVDAESWFEWNDAGVSVFRLAKSSAALKLRTKAGEEKTVRPGQCVGLDEGKWVRRVAQNCN